MSEIFINYRTGDTEETAATVDTDLSYRFGSDRVFYASKSIKAARPFDVEILERVRASKVLIALIGRRWLSLDNEERIRLHDEDDWVRREIREALSCGVHVLPVLVGRRTERISPQMLPADIKALALRQTKRYDHRDSAECLAALARAVADLIPGLVDRSITATAGSGTPGLDQAGRGSNTVTGAATVKGSVFQVGEGVLRHRTNENSHNRTRHTTNSGQFAGVRSISGELSGTFFNDSHGPVHTGSGDQYLAPTRLSAEQAEEGPQQA